MSTLGHATITTTTTNTITVTIKPPPMITAIIRVIPYKEYIPLKYFIYLFTNVIHFLNFPKNSCISPSFIPY